MNKNIFTQSKMKWLLLISIIVVEYLFFRSYATREVINYYPTNFDQASYLLNSYIAYESVLKHGFLYLLQHDYGRNAASSIFILQAVFVFLLFGASRLAALSINFLFFIALQLITFQTAKQLSGKYSLAFLLLGLVLLVKTPYFWAGGIFDFRMDFTAYCLFGICIACILRSRIFLIRKWVFISAFATAYLILLRHIAAFYLGGVIFFLFLYLVIARLRSTQPLLESNNHPHYNKQIKNIMLYSFIILVITLPFLWLAKEDIYSYYVVGHVSNEERFMRALQVGVTNLLSNILFYPTSLFKDHIGRFESYILLTLIIGTRIIGRKSFQYNNATTVFLFLCLIIPLIVLTADTSKSFVVADIMVAPAIWLAWWLTCSAYNDNRENKPLTFFLNFFSIVVLLLGIKNFAGEMRHHNREQYHNDMTEISRMYNDIIHYYYIKKTEKITFSTDHIADYLCPANLNILYYEKHGVIPTVMSTLGTSYLQRVTKKEALQELETTDVFIINKDPYQIGADDYPFNIAIEKIRLDLLKDAQKRFHVLGDYNFKSYHYRVYVK